MPHMPRRGCVMAEAFVVTLQAQQEHRATQPENPNTSKELSKQKDTLRPL